VGSRNKFKFLIAMKIPYKLFIPFVFLLVGCGLDSVDTETTEEAVIPSKKGGVFRMSIGSFFKCVQVNEVQKHEESQVYWQIFEGLVKYNSETLKIEPSWIDLFIQSYR
jgi:ABC-type oligopeptide transport system substrate-binding subunit